MSSVPLLSGAAGATADVVGTNASASAGTKADVISMVVDGSSLPSSAAPAANPVLISDFYKLATVLYNATSESVYAIDGASLTATMVLPVVCPSGTCTPLCYTWNFTALAWEAVSGGVVGSSSNFVTCKVNGEVSSSSGLGRKDKKRRREKKR